MDDTIILDAKTGKPKYRLHETPRGLEVIDLTVCPHEFDAGTCRFCKEKEEE